MGGEGMPCAECSMNCSLMHRKGLDHSPIVSSFFKVMYGKHFSEKLIVPPKFARTLIPSLDQKFYLEDSNGKKWNVVLSKEDGCLAFLRGWNEFSLDHGIELGDFVVFHYIRGSHFVVQIYGRSGCEKPTSYGKRSYHNKKTKTTLGSAGGNSPCNSFNEDPPLNEDISACEVSGPDIDVIQRQDNVCMAGDVRSRENIVKRPKVAPTTDFLVDPCFMTNRETSFGKQDEKECLLDLSIFEMPTKEVSSKLVNVETGAVSIDFEKCDIAEGNTLSNYEEASLPRNKYPPLSSCPCPSIIDMPLSPIMPLKPVGMPLKLESMATSEYEETSLSRNEYPPLSSCPCPSIDMPLSPIMPLKPVGMPLKLESMTTSEYGEASLSKEEYTPPPSSCPSVEIPLSSCMPLKTIKMPLKQEFSVASDTGVTRLVKQEPMESSQDFGDASLGISWLDAKSSMANFNNGEHCEKLNHMVKGIDGVDIVVKAEPVDVCDSSSAPVIKVTCLVPPGSDSFLELPERLPVKVNRPGPKFEKLVLLQDPTKRLWPVVYHQRCGFKVLASGWKRFREASNVKPGDECTFIVENMNEGIFSVQVLRSCETSTTVQEKVFVAATDWDM